MELVQEKNAEYLQHVNQLLHDKLSDHHHFTELQIQNSALKLQLTELQHDYTRLQQEESGNVAPKPLMVEKSSNTMDYSLLDPPTSTISVVPGPVSVEGKFLTNEVCAKFWEIESKISLSVDLHQFYEIHRGLLLAMMGYELEEVLDRLHFLQCGHYVRGSKLKICAQRF